MGYRPHVQLSTNENNWDDLRVPISSVRLGAGAPPTETTYKGGSVLAFPTNANATIYFNVQLSHKWREGSSIDPHIHWTIDTNGAAGGAENVKWILTYSWANINSSFPSESSMTKTVDVSNSAADDHTYTDFTLMTSTGKTISSIIICSLMRDVTVADDYTGNAYLVDFDFHYKAERAGSFNETFTP